MATSVPNSGEAYGKTFTRVKGKDGKYGPENGGTFAVTALAGLLMLGGIYAWRRGE